MPPFRVVAGEQAGPAALGILVPPGRRTTIVVRPRALDWDLLPLGPGAEKGVGPLFWEIGRDEAEGFARNVLEALEQCAAGNAGRVEAAAAPRGDGYQVRAALGPFVLIVCRREPGKPYQPAAFAGVAEALAAAQRITRYLCPAGAAEQEIYLNSRNFSR